MESHHMFANCVTTGTLSTIVVYSLPPGLVMDGVYKVVAAILTAVMASVASFLVRRLMQKLLPKQGK